MRPVDPAFYLMLMLTLAVTSAIFAIYLAIKRPEFHGRPLSGVVRCYVQGHPLDMLMRDILGLYCGRCCAALPDLEEEEEQVPWLN